MVLGGFTCSKHSLIILNVIYIIVSFIIIGVAAYGRAAVIVTSLTLVGSLIACGVFLFIIALVGFLGAIKHHQVLLFFRVLFLVLGGQATESLLIACLATMNVYLAITGSDNVYMIMLFLLFLLQFSLACACLAVNSDQKESLAKQGWIMSGAMTRMDVQQDFDCCGYQDQDLPETEPLGHPECGSSSACCASNPTAPCCTGQYNQTVSVSCPCDSCFSKMEHTIYNAFSVTGGVCLFFSFTEVIGVWVTIRLRNQKDPSANPSAFL